MLNLDLSTSLLFFSLPFIFLFCKSIFSNFFSTKNYENHVPKSYPFIGTLFDFRANRHRLVQWTSDAVLSSPTLSFVLSRPFGPSRVITANPAVVQHILKTNFPNYIKGNLFITSLKDFLGDGIFNTDGQSWKFQRQVASHEFNTRSLRNFLDNVVETELSSRLVPILTTTAANKTTVDLQDILQRFAFDNICKIAFGYDPAYLTPSFSKAKFATAFEDATRIGSERLHSTFPLIWKIKRFFNVGSEKQLRNSVAVIREFASNLIKEKKQEIALKSELESVDILSRFLSSGHNDENFVADIIISFILAGQDTTSAALTWFFWLVSKNPKIEKEILKEINEMSDSSNTVYEEVKDMIYTHASLCESMRLYPPVPVDTKEVVADDILPGGTVVKKGMGVSYHPYAMGRVEKIWGKDWAEFKPERWLERDGVTGKWKFISKDTYTYPVFQAGPRICLGKDMAFLQMKMVVAGVLSKFRVVPAIEGDTEPVFMAYLTSKMKGGFPVKIEERVSQEVDSTTCSTT